MSEYSGAMNKVAELRRALNAVKVLPPRAAPYYGPLAQDPAFLALPTDIQQFLLSTEGSPDDPYGFVSGDITDAEALFIERMEMVCADMRASDGKLFPFRLPPMVALALIRKLGLV